MIPAGFTWHDSFRIIAMKLRLYFQHYMIYMSYGYTQYIRYVYLNREENSNEFFILTVTRESPMEQIFNEAPLIRGMSPERYVLKELKFLIHQFFF